MFVLKSIISNKQIPKHCFLRIAKQDHKRIYVFLQDKTLYIWIREVDLKCK